MIRKRTDRPRRPGILATVGLIVEGETEFRALPRLHKESLIAGCPPLRAINLNGVGSHLTASGVAKRLAPKVSEHQVAGRDHIVVCIDRESRGECAPAFSRAVSEALAREMVSRNSSSEGVTIVVADRAFETFLLAGADGLHARGKLLRAPSARRFEGQMGQAGRKGERELSKLLGRPYVKTIDGPALFESLDFTIARNHRHGAVGSRSLDKLLRAIGI